MEIDSRALARKAADLNDRLRALNDDRGAHAHTRARALACMYAWPLCCVQTTRTRIGTASALRTLRTRRRRRRRTRRT